MKVDVELSLMMEKKTVLTVYGLPVSFPAIWLLDHHDSTSNQLPQAHLSIYIQINCWKLPEKFLIFRAIWSFGAQSRQNDGDFRGNELIFLIVVKKYFYLIYILPFFGVVCKKLHCWRQTVEIVSLSLHRFMCRANRDLKSRSKTTPRLILMTRI